MSLCNDNALSLQGKATLNEAREAQGGKN